MSRYYLYGFITLYLNLLYVLQGMGMYHKAIKAVEEDTINVLKRVNELCGIKESDTGLAMPAHWDLAADKEAIQS
jgi:26S proteasome regulatory subunit T1